MAYATERVLEIEGIRLIGTAKQKASVLGFVHETGCILTTSVRCWMTQGMAIRAGHHCAQPVMERFGVPATARASFAFYNTLAEVDAFIAGLSDCQEDVCLMASLSGLYQDMILDHNRAPQNFRRMDDANRRAEGNNPLCGDRLTVWLKMEDGMIQDAAFQGSGCAISKASASLMTSAVKGKTRQRLRRSSSGSGGW